MKVAVVSGEYPPFSIGGISSVCHDLAMSLSKRGISTTVFTGKSKRMSVEKVDDYLNVVRLPVTDLPPRHLWFPLQNLGTLPRLLKEFDVIHNADPRAAGVLAWCGGGLSNPIVTHSHTCGHCEAKAFLQSPLYSWSVAEFIYNLEYPLNHILEDRSLNRSDHIVVCSKVRLEEMKRTNRYFDFNKVSIIYNGINFAKICCDNLVEEDDCSLLFWGRMDYRKGIIQLIEAMAIVKREYPNVSLDVCGKGPLETKVRNLVSKLGLTDNIRLHGYVSKEFLVKKIRKATVVVLPSLYEGQPVAALEAMAYRKPLIVYDFPFAREYVTDYRNGLTAKGGDVKDLAERICHALSDGRLRVMLAQNAHEHVKKYHNWDTLVDQYIQIYVKLAC